MLALGLLFLWASPSLAGNSTATEGWQHNGNTRSTWDISWACLSTVLACTWTVLHRDVPARNISNFRISFGKFVSLFLAIMAPELVAWIAVQELQRARSTASRCTSSQTLSDRVTKEPTLRAHQRTKPIAQAQSDSNNDSALSPSSHSTWTVAQGFCINMGGLAMQTEDEWTYPVEPDTAQLLVEAGFIRCSDFRERDIQDRSKADSFAKAFTVLQSTWSTVNIVARAAYNLPISPLELSIVAYVSCALFTYAFWWHKPKDMTTPITVNLRCTRNNLPQELQNITNANPKKWIHLRVVPAKESIFSLPQIIRQWYDGVKAQEQTRGPPAGSPSKFSSRDEALLDAFGVLASILFCGIHIAAWNFLFPTPAERITWRIFALIAISMACAFYIVGQLPPIARCLAKRFTLPFSMKELADPATPFTKFELYLSFLFQLVYLIARLGILALTLSSLRALPVGSYTCIDWLASIPHI